MTATVIISLPDPIATQVDSFAARAGMTASSWLAEQVAHAFGTGMVRETVDPPRQSRSSRRRHAKRAREARAARAATSTPSTV